MNLVLVSNNKELDLKYTESLLLEKINKINLISDYIITLDKVVNASILPVKELNMFTSEGKSMMDYLRLLIREIKKEIPIYFKRCDDENHNPLYYIFKINEDLSNIKV